MAGGLIERSHQIRPSTPHHILIPNTTQNGRLSIIHNLSLYIMDNERPPEVNYLWVCRRPREGGGHQTTTTHRKLTHNTICRDRFWCGGESHNFMILRRWRKGWTARGRRRRFPNKRITKRAMSIFRLFSAFWEQKLNSWVNMNDQQNPEPR